MPPSTVEAKVFVPIAAPTENVYASIGHAAHHARDRRQRRTEEEREGDDMVDVDAHQFSRFPYPASRNAWAMPMQRFVDEQGEGDQKHDRRDDE